MANPFDRSGHSTGKCPSRANLPENLFGHENAPLSTEEYFRLWKGVEEEANDPTLPLQIGAAISVEAFNPPVFATLCSPNLNTALKRIARYKRLVCPMVLHIGVNDNSTCLEFEWIDTTVVPPVSLVATELVFFVQLARLATRRQMFLKAR